MARKVDSPPGGQDSSSASDFLLQLLGRAREQNVSDIHLRLTPETGQVSFRVDGILIPVESISPELARSTIGRIKFLARLKTYQESFPQDGRISSGDSGISTEVRVATYPAVSGEKVVLRLFTTKSQPDLQGIGFDDQTRTDLEKAISQPSGMVLLTGPSGSGKTTTIYASLKYIHKTHAKHIITIEDPVEQILPDIMQTEINEARELTFAAAARHLLRQDPEVLVVGEIRDEDTARIAVRAALTGHLLIATLHAGSCSGVIERLAELCGDHQAALNSLNMVWNQRLVRKICANCQGLKCDQCFQTGFNGRIPLVEYIRISDEVRRQWKSSGSLEGESYSSLREKAGILVTAGFTSPDEIERVLGPGF